MKKRKPILKKLTKLFVCSIAGLALASCTESDLEEATDEVGDAVEEAGDKVEEAADDLAN